MKPTLENTPESFIKDLEAQFDEGKPLTPDQLNFLALHEKSLSNPHMDSIYKYYLKHTHHPYLDEHSFLLPSEIMNKEAIQKLKRRLQAMLKQKSQHVILKFTSKQFQELKKITFGELIFHHGNQFITGAPFFPGGIPHVIFFQWGNLFGVAKYVVLSEEKSLKGNVLIYFEDMADRLIDECIHDYNHKHQDEIKPQQESTPTQEPEPSPSTSKMNLSVGSNEKEEKN